MMPLWGHLAAGVLGMSVGEGGLVFATMTRDSLVMLPLGRLDVSERCGRLVEREDPINHGWTLLVAFYLLQSGLTFSVKCDPVVSPSKRMEYCE